MNVYKCMEFKDSLEKLPNIWKGYIKIFVDKRIPKSKLIHESIVYYTTLNNSTSNKFTDWSFIINWLLQKEPIINDNILHLLVLSRI